MRREWLKKSIRRSEHDRTSIRSPSDGSADSFNVYTRRDDIPENIRHYAPEGEPVFVGPDMAFIFGVRDVLYPNFPDCSHPEYPGKRCIAESCKYAVGGDWTKCPHFNR